MSVTNRSFCLQNQAWTRPKSLLRATNTCGFLIYKRGHQNVTKWVHNLWNYPYSYTISKTFFLVSTSYSETTCSQTMFQHHFRPKLKKGIIVLFLSERILYCTKTVQLHVHCILQVELIVNVHWCLATHHVNCLKNWFYIYTLLSSSVKRMYSPFTQWRFFIQHFFIPVVWIDIQTDQLPFYFSKADRKEELPIDR